MDQGEYDVLVSYLRTGKLLLFYNAVYAEPRTRERQNFLGAAIFPRKYGRSVKLGRPNILGYLASATIFPGDNISCDTGIQHIIAFITGTGTPRVKCLVPVPVH